MKGRRQGKPGLVHAEPPWQRSTARHGTASGRLALSYAARRGRGVREELPGPGASLGRIQRGICVEKEGESSPRRPAGRGQGTAELPLRPVIVGGWDEGARENPREILPMRNFGPVPEPLLKPQRMELALTHRRLPPFFFIGDLRLKRSSLSLVTLKSSHNCTPQ